MDILNINSNTSAANNQRSDKSDNKLGQQQFLQLLVAQMRHQDPINPLNGAEFAAQLAQFNSVEQLINVNNGLKILQEGQDLMSASMTNSMAASLSGKEVKAMSNEVYLASGESANITFDLYSSAEEVEIIIKSASGAEIRRETLKGMPSGNSEWTWDGRNDAGARVADGEYIVEINAKNGDSNVDSLLFTKGSVEKVRYTGRGVYLLVNNIEIPIGDVQEVSDKTTQNF
ncbi:MAG: flagellar hook capping FlgD N-terminal domain-containing protein [Balneolaceae bacterium]